MMTTSLEELLMHFRRKDVDRILWVDSVSINQEDIQERGEQVQIMHEIYAGASGVVVWLGTQQSFDTTAISAIEWLSEHKEWCVWDILDSDVQEQLRTMLHDQQPDLDSTSAFSILPALWKPLRSFLLARPWFRRAWTFQETVMGQNVTLYAGTRSITWTSLYEACKFLLNHHIYLETQIWEDEGLLLVQSIISRESVRRRTAENQFALKELLPMLRSAGATDPRDKVFALYGVASDRDESQLRPDYSLSVGKVYQAVAERWAGATDEDRKVLDISFLSHVQSANSTFELPSWVPDWTMPLSSPVLADMADFCAAGASRAKAAFEPPPRPPQHKLWQFYRLEEEINAIEASTEWHRPFRYFNCRGLMLFRIKTLEDRSRGLEHHHEMLQDATDSEDWGYGYRNARKHYPMTTMPYWRA
jgi:hypothetical protein